MLGLRRRLSGFEIEEGEARSLRRGAIVTAHWTDALVRLNACEEAVEWCQTQPDLATAWATCERADWMLWLLEHTEPEAGTGDHRKLVGCSAEIARTVLHLFENARPGDSRVRACLDFCDRYAAEAAEAAAWGAGDARAAAWAAEAAVRAAWAAGAAEAAARAVRAAWAAGAAARAAEAAEAAGAAGAAVRAAVRAAEAAGDARAAGAAAHKDNSAIVRKWFPTAQELEVQS